MIIVYKKRWFPLLMLFFLLVVSCKDPITESKQPNFLFVMVDDQPYDALEKSGRYPFLKTPNLSRLQDEGVTFENFFCTASLCSPSRASFMTGTYPHKHGVNQNNEMVDPNWEQYAPVNQWLQQGGYETAFVGKIHMASLSGRNHIRPGFDYWLSFNGQGKYYDTDLNENGREFQAKGYITDVLTDYAEDWLNKKRDTTKPFYLCVWHKAVHEPYTPSNRHINLYANDSLPIPPYNTHLENFSGKPDWQRIKAYDINWFTYQPVDSLPKKPWDFHNPRYMDLLRCISGVDDSMGRLLKNLEESGELDNTVIIYTSDNGYFMGEHTYWDKRIAYENSMRIPMLIRYPKKWKKGTTEDKMGLNVDMAPTILDLAGLPIPDYMQGLSLLPLATNSDNVEWRKSFLFEYYVDDDYPYAGPDLVAVRTNRYKLVDNNLENDIDEFYNLENDPGEMINLINDENYQKEIETVRDELHKLKENLDYRPDRDFWLNEYLSKDTIEE